MKTEKKKIIVANLKMNLLSVLERNNYLKSLSKEIDKKGFNDVDVVFCPPSLYLEKFSEELKKKKIFLGSQNIHWEKKGAFTGEISAPMIKAFGSEYCIVGHSERRQYFGENNENVNLKIKAVLEEKLVPIFCFGETKNERDLGVTKDVITKQIIEGLGNISGGKIPNIVFAYEPVWSIGAGTVPSSNEIMEVRILVKKIVTDRYGSEKAEKVRVLYGGSVDSKNIKEVCIDSGMDGALVGGQSLIPLKFMELARILNK